MGIIIFGIRNGECLCLKIYLIPALFLNITNSDIIAIYQSSIHINILRRMKMNTRGEELIDSYEHEQEDSHSFKGHILDIYAYRTDDGKIEIRFDDIHYHKPKYEVL